MTWSVSGATCNPKSFDWNSGQNDRESIFSFQSARLPFLTLFVTHWNDDDYGVAVMETWVEVDRYGAQARISITNVDRLARYSPVVSAKHLTVR